MHKFKLDDFENKYKKTQKNRIDCEQLHYNLQNKPHFPIRGKTDQLTCSKKKRALW